MSVTFQTHSRNMYSISSNLCFAQSFCIELNANLVLEKSVFVSSHTAESAPPASVQFRPIQACTGLSSRGLRGGVLTLSGWHRLQQPCPASLQIDSPLHRDQCCWSMGLSCPSRMLSLPLLGTRKIVRQIRYHGPPGLVFRRSSSDPCLAQAPSIVLVNSQCLRLVVFSPFGCFFTSQSVTLDASKKCPALPGTRHHSLAARRARVRLCPEFALSALSSLATESTPSPS